MKNRRKQNNPYHSNILKIEEGYSAGDELNPQLIWQIVRRSTAYRRIVDSFVKEFNDSSDNEDPSIANFFTELFEDSLDEDIYKRRRTGRLNRKNQDFPQIIVKETPRFIREKKSISSIENFREKTNYLMDFPLHYEIEVIPEYYFYFFNFFYEAKTKIPSENKFTSTVCLNLALPKKHLVTYISSHIDTLQASRQIKPVFNNLKALAPDDFEVQIFVWEMCNERVPYSEIAKKIQTSIADVRRKRSRIQVLINEFERFLSK